jgi:hypothetical protein
MDKYLINGKLMTAKQIKDLKKTEIEERAKQESQEYRDRLISKLSSMGIKFKESAKTEALEALLSEASDEE